MKHPRFSIRKLMIVVAMIAGWLYVDPARGVVWDGIFPLQLDVRDNQGHKIVAVATQLCVGREGADFLRAHPGSPEINLTPALWVEGEPVRVDVRCSGHSWFGREVAYAQYKGLLMRVEYEDGWSRLVSLTIPDGRVRRRVNVSIP
jgi:hypothetical protein